MPSGWRSSSSRRSKKLAKLAELGARQISRTDPDGRFLHQADDFVLGYTADLAVSDDHRIVAQRTTQAVSDSASLLPMVDRRDGSVRGMAGRGQRRQRLLLGRERGGAGNAGHQRFRPRRAFGRGAEEASRAAAVRRRLTRACAHASPLAQPGRTGSLSKAASLGARLTRSFAALKKFHVRTHPTRIRSPLPSVVTQTPRGGLV